MIKSSEAGMVGNMEICHQELLTKKGKEYETS